MSLCLLQNTVHQTRRTESVVDSCSRGGVWMSRFGLTVGQQSTQLFRRSAMQIIPASSSGADHDCGVHQKQRDSTPEDMQVCVSVR